MLPALAVTVVALAITPDACAQAPVAAAPAAAAASAAGGDRRAQSVVLQARELRARPDIDVVAEGAVEFVRGPVSIAADRLSYDLAEDLARALGDVRIRRDGATYSGPELALRVERFEGYFLAPEFAFDRLGTSGRADRVDFLDSARSRVVNALYTSCPRDGSGDPDWVLQADRLRLDLDANVGIAEGARLRFLGVTILALPTLSFPLTGERKSGWLPPSVNIDNRSGLDVSAPYYWNIAPDRDATISPRVMTRRGVGVEAEFRYLAPQHAGRFLADWLPNDRVAGRSRHALSFSKDSQLPLDLRLHADGVRVSDDNWWKDFPRSNPHPVPRLLPLNLQLERDFGVAGGAAQAYARVLHWQVLQDLAAPIVAPYERSPQIGLRWSGRGAFGTEFDAETEFNRFTLPAGDAGSARSEGRRWHVSGSLSRPWRAPGWWVVPRLAVNAAQYRTEKALADGSHGASRAIPTLSLDAGLVFERDTQGFGRALRQSLSPRLLYVQTPFHDQSGLPNFDAAGKDFNFASIYSDNAFSGIDRVSDAHQFTVGIDSRLTDATSGVEVLRLGLAQRYLLRDQRLTPEGVPLTQRFSDLLLLGSTALVPRWTLDAALQYSPELTRPVRTVLGARYSPGPFRTVSASYRFARGTSEQLALGWQWPLLQGNTGGERCGRNWYSVGRVNFSVPDSRITDSVFGFEVDAGCWIGRVVAERRSTGLTEATTRLLLQLELSGLSRLGSNPLQVLKDNIPGYRLLREDRSPNLQPELP